MSEPAPQHATAAPSDADADSAGAASLAALAAQCAGQFGGRFGAPVQWMVAAPGRVNLIGEHVDYNDGFVLPMAIQRHVVIAAAPAGAKQSGKASVVTLASTRQEQAITIDLSQPIRPGEPTWGNYARGIIAAFIERGVSVPPFNALIAANLPTGGGLSSSAAIEVAVATLLESITGHKLDPRDKALLCQHAEHTFAGVPCGIMDQFACTLGKRDHLLLLDCRSLDLTYVPFNDPDVTLLVIDSKVKHELAGGEYARRRRDCERATARLGVSSLRDLSMDELKAGRSKLSPTEYRRARHVVGEILRTQAAAVAIAAGDWRIVGQLMYESHESLRDDYEVSCDELDLIVELARGFKGEAEDAVLGCRMTGGGFGGCAVCLVRTDAVDAVTRHIEAEYERRTGIAPAIFSTRPADGAGLLSGSR